MRYCSRCGNALNVGASFCHSCGAALKVFVPEEDDTPVAEMAAEEVIAPAVETVAEEPVAQVPAVTENIDADIAEEQEFLDSTHRLLRWERKAWSITGKVFLIMGIIFAAVFFLMGVMLMATGEEEAVAVGIIMGFTYSIVFGGMLIVIGLVNKINANKIPQYTNTLYKDFRAANTRCSSIGMIVLSYFFNNIAMVFYLINFVRMKCSKKLINRIMTRQKVQ